jgi:hypothetical protein
MADAEGSRLNLGSLVAPRGRGRPRGSKNMSNTTLAAAGTSLDAPAKRHPGRPPGSKNKPKVTGAAPSPVLLLLLLLPLPLLFLKSSPFSAFPWRSAVRFSACR